MNIHECQREMRTSFLGGFAGQLVSGVIWWIAAAAGQFSRPAIAMAVLFFGSMFIFAFLGRSQVLNEEAAVQDAGPPAEVRRVR